MAVNIGPKIGIDGEKEYRQQINDIITQTKTLSSEMKALTSSFDKEKASVAQNKQQKALLTQQIDLQKQKVNELNSMLQQSATKYGENDAKTLKWKQSVNYATVELNQLESKLQSMPSTLDIVGQKFQSVGDKITGISGKIKGAGQTLTMSVTAPIAGAGVAAVKYASDFDENMNKVDVAFKSNADQVKAWAQTATTQFGLSENAALEATSLFGDMGTSMGLTTEESATMATNLAGLAGDLSSFKNVGIDQAMTALNGVFTGETESLKQLGVVMTQTNLEEFASKTGRVYKEMSQAEKVALRYEYVMEQTKNAQGDYARTSDGTANSLRTMQASLDNLAVAFGSELLPAITPVINSITDVINEFGKLDEGTKKTIITIAGIAAAVGPVLVVLGTLGTAIGGIATGVGVVMPVIGAIGGVLAGVGAAAAAAVPAVLAFLAPFAPFIAIAAAVVAAGVLIYKNWDTIKEYAGKLGEAIGEKWGEIKEKTSEIWNNVKETVSGKMEAIRSNVGERLGRIKSAFVTNGGGIKGTVAAAWQGIKEYYRAGFDVVNSLTGGKLGEIKNKFSEGWNNIKSNTSQAWSNLKSTVSSGAADIKNKFTSSMSNMASNASSKWSDIKSKFTSGMSNLISGVANGVSDIKEKFRSKLSEIASDAWGWGADIINGVIDGIRSKVASVASAASSVASTIRSYLHFSVPDKGPLADFNSYMPDMMKGLARGMISNLGTVENAASQVAGAIAMPAGSNSSTAYNYGGFTVNVYGAEGQDVNELADVVADKINSAINRGNAVWA